MCVTLMFMARSRARVASGASPAFRKVTIPHRSAPRSCTRHARHLRKLAAQQRRERLDPRLDRVHAEIQRVADGDRQSDLAGDVPLPVLEAAGILADHVGVGVDPERGLEIDEGRLEGARWCRAARTESPSRAGRAGTCVPWPRACGSRSGRRRRRAGRPIGRRRADTGCRAARRFGPPPRPD